MFLSWYAINVVVLIWPLTLWTPVWHVFPSQGSLSIDGPAIQWYVANPIPFEQYTDIHPSWICSSSHRLCVIKPICWKWSTDALAFFVGHLSRRCVPNPVFLNWPSHPHPFICSSQMVCDQRGLVWIIHWWSCPFTPFSVYVSILCSLLTCIWHSSLFSVIPQLVGSWFCSLWMDPWNSISLVHLRTISWWVTNLTCSQYPPTCLLHWPLHYIQYSKSSCDTWWQHGILRQ